MDKELSKCFELKSDSLSKQEYEQVTEPYGVILTKEVIDAAMEMMNNTPPDPYHHFSAPMMEEIHKAILKDVNYIDPDTIKE